MKENFLHFLSKEPCLLYINGENIGTIDNEGQMEIDIVTKTDNIYVTYEPISIKTQALPYTIQLKTSETPSTTNEYTTIIPFPNNHYDIIMTPFYHYQIINSKVLFNGNVGEYFVSIVCDTNTRVVIYSGLTIIFNTTLPLFTAVKVEKIKTILLINGVIDNTTYYMLALDTKNFDVIYNDYAHSIESSNDQISLYKSINTLCHHAVVCNINFNTKNKEKFYVFEDNLSNTNINPILIPFAFLECLQISDEKTAKTLLSHNYSSYSIDKFKSYFGDIEEIYLNRHEYNPHKLNYTIKASKYRNYNFLMDNNKIYDIIEVF